MPYRNSKPQITQYCHNDITRWQQEVSSLNASISHEHRTASDARGEISRSQRIIDEVTPSIDDLNYHIRRAEERDRRRREQEHASKEHKEGGSFHNLLDLIHDIAGDPSVNYYKDKRRPLLAKRDQAESERSSARSKLRSAENAIETMDRQRSKLSYAIDEGSRFLSSLRDQPASLCRNLTGRVLAVAHTHENKHPSDQSIQTRLFLYRIQDQVDAILNARAENELTEQRLWQWRFALLNGYLWSVWNNLKANDEVLAREVENILQEMHIAEDGALPDNMAIGQSGNQLFMTFKPANPLYNVTETELEAIEKDAYLQARGALENTVGQDPLDVDLKTKATLILDKTQEDKLLAEKPKPDYKLHAKILSKTHAVITQPADPVVLDEYAELANHVQGKPSLLKKVGGVMLGILGVAILVGSTIALVASFGASAPLNCVTGLIGTSMLTKGLAGAGIGLGVIGFPGALGLFGNGMRKGLSKMMKTIEATRRATLGAPAAA